MEDYSRVEGDGRAFARRIFEDLVTSVLSCEEKTTLFKDNNDLSSRDPRKTCHDSYAGTATDTVASEMDPVSCIFSCSAVRSSR